MPLRERVAVVVVRVVDPAAGIGVLEPGAADVGVLLDTTNGTPACCSRCAASRPDMPAPMITTRKSASGASVVLAASPARDGPRRGSASSSSSSGRYGGHRRRHRRVNSMICSSSRRPRAAVPAGIRRRGKRISGLQRECRGLRPAARRSSPPCGMRDEQWVGAQVVAQQREVAGDVRERRQQRRRSRPPRARGRISSSVAVIGLDVADERARRRLGRHAHSVTPFGACWFMKPNM